jgi:uncharacterized protein YlxW (UPF0749 family)
MAFKYEHHPHSEARQPHKAAVEGFNNRLGLAITKRIGTMWAAYAFGALALISLPAAVATGDVRVIVDWVAQTFLQLVLVSVIIVGQNQQTRAAEKRAEATYKDATALLHEVKQLQSHLSHQEAQLAELRELVAKGK